jgi:TRAP-type C4-dicarboxylate transport system permease small subunit
MEDGISVANRSHLKKVVDFATKALAILGMWLIAAMGILILVDVFLRLVGRPFLGMFQIIELMLTICVFSAIAYTWTIQGHIRVTLFIDRFRPATQTAVDILACLCGIPFFGLIAWQNVIAGVYVYKIKDVTWVTQIPIYPVYAFIVLGSSLLTIQMLITLALSVGKLVKLARSGN